MERLPQSCTDVQAALPLYAGSDLEAAELEAVAVHLDRCTECRALAERASAARAVLADLRVEQAGQAVPDLWSGVRDRLQAEGLLGPAADSPVRVETAAGTILPFRPVQWARGLAAAAAVIIGIALWRGQTAPPGAPEPGSTVPATTTSVASSMEPVATVQDAEPVLVTPVALERELPQVALAEESAQAGRLEHLSPGSEHLIESARIFRPEEMVLRQGGGKGSTLASSPMRILRRRMR